MSRLISSQKERDFVKTNYDDIKREYELHRLLSALLSIELSTDEKLGIMETEYNIPINDKMREDVNAMCNLSQGIREKGRAEGRAEGRTENEKKVIVNMYTNHFTLEQIALATGRGIEDIKAVIEEKEPELA